MRLECLQYQKPLRQTDLGIRVLGIACITNMATGIAKKKHSHEEVVKMANKSSEQLCRWVETLLQEW